MKIDDQLQAADLIPAIEQTLVLAGEKTQKLTDRWDPTDGSPVFTIEGKYTSRGWTEWTEGFVYGNALLVFEGTDYRPMLELGRKLTLERMAKHLTHVGVHDHGFNNLSTYGNLRRLMRAGRIDHDPWQARFYELAIKASGAVQASRWTPIEHVEPDGSTTPGGFIHSFNGPQSLFVDTMRSLRIVALSHQLGHVLMGEHDEPINLLGRAIEHALSTSRYIVFFGQSSHSYDVRGRTAHEAIFNVTDGRFRCRSSQQGYSPFSTWTRGLSWAVLGYPEQLEFLATLDDAEIERARPDISAAQVREAFLEAARATADHFIDDCAAADGAVYWDDGAPGLSRLGDWQNKPADPFNDHEPVDSSASAIAAQGLLRLGRVLESMSQDEAAKRYTQAGLTMARTMLAEPYLSTDVEHEGLLLHSVYHRPNNWDHVPAGGRVPCGESCMWGDYHLLELAVTIQQMAQQQQDVLTFF